MELSIPADLKSAVDSGKLVCIVGPAVIADACGAEQECGTRRGLLEHGLRHCVQFKLLDESQMEVWRKLLEVGGDGLKAVARQIMDLLSRAKGELGSWLQDALGSLRVRNPVVLEALRDLGGAMATTTLDGLLADFTDREIVAWNDPNGVSRALSDEQLRERKLVHLLGIYKKPASVVLSGTRQHEKWSKDPLWRELLHSHRLLGNLLLVGFEVGEDDPLLAVLRESALPAHGELENRHYRIVRHAGLEAARREHQDQERVVVLPYGDSASELAAFLRSLRSSTPANRGPSPGPRRTPPAPTPALHQLPGGVLPFEAAAGQLHVVLPRQGRRSFTAVARILFPRSGVDALMADLAKAQKAILEGAAGSGKTTMALQLAAHLESEACPPALTGIRVYYARAADVPGLHVFDFLDRAHDGPTLLILDDVHEEEQVTNDLLGEWTSRRQQGGCQRVHLLLLTQGQETLSDEGDHERRNIIFHEVNRVTHALPERREFTDLLASLWALVSADPMEEEQKERITAFARNSPALASLAIDAWRQDLWNSEDKFRRMLIASVKDQYLLTSDIEKDLREASILTAFGIPIDPAAFGLRRSDVLLRKKFLCKTGRGGRHRSVFSRTVAELVFEEEVRSDKEIVEALVRYIKHDEANYHQVLAALLRARYVRPLRDVINQGFQSLKKHLGREHDLYRLSVALEAIAGCKRGVARMLFDAAIEERSLSQRLIDAQPLTVGRFLSVATYSDRRLFSPPEDSHPLTIRRAEDAKIVLDYLADLVARPDVRLTMVADICEAVGRSSRPAAVRLIQRAIEERGLADQTREELNKEDLLVFAGRICWLDYQRVRPLVRDSTQAVLLAASCPRAARRIILSLAAYSVKRARETLEKLPKSAAYRGWLERMVAPPTNLHDIASLLGSIGQISWRVGRRIAEDIYTPLEQAIERDRRLTAVGYLLRRLRDVHLQVARNLLSWLIERDILQNLLRQDWQPVHFGRTVEAIGLISQTWISRYMSSLQKEDWIALFGKARSLSAASVLLRGIGRAAIDPDGLLVSILREPVIRAQLYGLGQRDLVATDLANFATTVELNCPISLHVRENLRKIVSHLSFERAIQLEEHPRRAGQALRAYAAAFPEEAAAFARRLTDSIDLKDKKRLRDVPNVWLSCDDLSATASLLQSAADVDGSLGDRLGAALDLRKLNRHLQSEAKVTRIAEFLQALAPVDPEKAQKLLRGLYQDEDPLRIVEELGSLRETTTFFSGIVSAGFGFYRWWLRNALSASPRGQARLLHELRTMCSEECNLATLGTTVRLLAMVDRKLVPQLLTSLDQDWVRQIAEWDNNIVQVLQFVASVGRCTDPKSRPLFLFDLISRSSLKRLSEIRSLRALSLCLTELQRAATSLNRPGILVEGWRSYPPEQVRRALETPGDIVGAAQFAFLMRRLCKDKLARELSSETERVVRDSMPASRATSALVALALLGTGREEITKGTLPRRLADEAKDLRMWHVGLANWISGLHEGSGERGPLLPLEHMPVDGWRGAQFQESLRQECHIAGGNVRFAFTLSLGAQLGWPLAGDLLDEMRKRAALRAKSEPAFLIRSMLRMLAGEPLGEHEVSSQEHEPGVVYCLRRLLPRIESLSSIDAEADAT